jgi:hypothetical protein
MPHQHDRARYLPDDRSDVGGVPDQAAVRHGRGHYVQPAGDQFGNDAGVAGRIGKGAVDQHNGRIVRMGHEELPFGCCVFG